LDIATVCIHGVRTATQSKKDYIFSRMIYRFNRSSGVDSNECWLSHRSLITSYEYDNYTSGTREGQEVLKFNDSLLSDQPYLK